jgi:hypothetical protein
LARIWQGEGWFLSFTCVLPQLMFPLHRPNCIRFTGSTGDWGLLEK